jgi:hypothetical protein
VTGEKVILPTWHNVDLDDIARNSPMLADRIAMNTSQGLEAAATAVVHAIRSHGGRSKTPSSWAAVEEGVPLQQRPPQPRALVGRDRIMHELVGSLVRGVGKVFAITGWPGVGKSALAAAICHAPAISKAFPDGILWASMGRTPDIRALLVGFGRTLGVTEIVRATDLSVAHNLLASRLRDRRVLIVLNDVWAADHASQLLVGGPNSATLLTTRLVTIPQQLDVRSGDAYVLTSLTESESLDLLRLLAPEAITRHPAEAVELVRELEGLPLALEIAAALLRVHGGADLSELLEDVRRGAGLFWDDRPMRTPSVIGSESS